MNRSPSESTCFGNPAGGVITLQQSAPRPKTCKIRLVPRIFALLCSEKTSLCCSKTSLCCSKTSLCCSKTSLCCSKTPLCCSKTPLCSNKKNVYEKNVYGKNVKKYFAVCEFSRRGLFFGRKNVFCKIVIVEL